MRHITTIAIAVGAVLLLAAGAFAYGGMNGGGGWGGHMMAPGYHMNDGYGQGYHNGPAYGMQQNARPGYGRAANVTESGDIGAFLLYLGSLWGLAVVVFPGVFFLAAWLGKKLGKVEATWRDITLRLTYIFIPLGIFAWISFSLPQVMINYGYILSVLSDPMGMGWDLWGTATQPFQPFWPASIPYLQGTLLLAGMYLGLSRGHASLAVAIAEPRARTLVMLPAVILTLVVVNVFLKLYMG